MRPLRGIAVYLAAVFVGGALLAPWLYWLVRSMTASQNFISGWLPWDKWAEMPFHRHVHRCFLIVALAGLWPFLRSIGARSWREVGMEHPRGHGRELMAGFAIGLGSLALVCLAAVASQARAFQTGQGMQAILSHLLRAGSSAAVVAIGEELFFRGALFGSLKKALPVAPALLASSAVYAILHFFQPATVDPPVTWASGLALLPRMMSGLGALDQLIPAFLTLMLAGVMLAVVFQRTGSLYGSIGLHAGWIFWLKTYGFFTTGQWGASTVFWGSSKLLDGWLALLVLGLSAPVVLAVFRPGSKPA